MRKRRRTSKKRRGQKVAGQAELPEGYLCDGGWSEEFGFIAGFTSGGAPFGVTWEELEALRPDEEVENMVSVTRGSPPLRT